MTKQAKQKEIERELYILTLDYFRRFNEEGDDFPSDTLCSEILSYLHSQGVVIKVKCPDCAWSQFKDEAVGMTPCYRCNSTGYITEPLIKE